MKILFEIPLLRIKTIYPTSENENHLVNIYLGPTIILIRIF